MRTTIDIPDETYRKLKVKAALEGEAMREIVLRSILRELERPAAKPVRRLTEPILKSYAPGSIQIDNERIYDLIGFP
jgi:plasmid stability protein